MGVAAVETINVEEDTDHDEDIARGVALEEHMSGQEPPASKSVTASTSSTSSSTASASSKMKLKHPLARYHSKVSCHSCI